MAGKVGAIIVTVANAIVWGTPAAIYSWLWFSKFADGPLPQANELGVVLLLLSLGPIQYCAGLVLSLTIPIRQIQKGRPGDALMAAIAFLILGMADAAWGISMLGST